VLTEAASRAMEGISDVNLHYPGLWGGWWNLWVHKTHLASEKQADLREWRRHEPKVRELTWVWPGSMQGPWTVWSALSLAGGGSQRPSGS
jgi:hypothetical protein